MTDGVEKKWWLAIAGLVAAVELVVVVGIWVDKLTADTIVVNGVEVELPGERLLAWGDILLTGLLALAGAAILAGLYVRTRQPVRSRWLIVAGLTPAALIGGVFFWFPPFWILSGLAIAALVGAIRGAAREPVAA